VLPLVVFGRGALTANRDQLRDREGRCAPDAPAVFADAATNVRCCGAVPEVLPDLATARPGRKLTMSMRLVRGKRNFCHQPQARERQKFKSCPKLILRGRFERVSRHP
jgi:hypothetical protein